LAAHRENSFHVNHTHFALPSGVVSLALKRKTGLPYVLTLHGSDVPGYNPDRFKLAHLMAAPLWRRVVREAEMIISPSHYLKGLFQEHIDLPVQVIPNGYHPSAERPQARNKRNRILVVSRMFKRKGIQYLLRALQGWDCHWEICVVGDGPYLKTLLEAAHGLSANVTFTGYVQGAALQDLYDSARIFVFPSLQENFPTVLMEAMDAGCAVITTSADGCAEVTNGAGIGVTPGSPVEIRDALQRLIANPTEIDRLSQLSRERIKQLSWRSIAQRYEMALLEVTQAKIGLRAMANPPNPSNHVVA
jgi:glycosyltransferase involved in cell wall biosynthesis